MGNETRPEIVYRDDSLVLLDKPGGVLVHRNQFDRQSPTCIDYLAGRLGRKVHTVHRIDRATSGLVLFALDPDTARDLAEQFRQQTVRKRYIAIVRGHLAEATTIDRQVKSGGNGPYVSARSHVTPLAWARLEIPVGRYEEAWYSLVAVDLETGRFHQARKHLHYCDHPIIGDKRHGDRDHNRFFAQRFGVEQLYLRAQELDFRHPRQGNPIRARAGLPELWRQVLSNLGLDLPAELSVDTTVGTS